MAIATFTNSKKVIEIMENFIDSRRPPVNIRHHLDLSYKIDDQSVIIFELRPHWKHLDETMECNIAKSTFVKSKNEWKVFWFMSDGKWHGYTPNPFVKTLQHFLKLVEEDKHNCFWG